MEHHKIISLESGLNTKQIAAVGKLLDEGATIPFIARYRKELTDSLDEVQISDIKQRLEQLKELDKRREAVICSVREQEKLTPELEAQFINAKTISELEDLYLPYKQKRKTRATMAIAKGLEPLAKIIFSQSQMDIELKAKGFIDDEKGVATMQDALAGARDIIAEWINENAETRARIRNLFLREAHIKSKVAKGREEKAEKYQNYFDWDEPLSKAPSHRVLAIFRGEKEELLKADVSVDEERGIQIVEKQFVKSTNEAGKQVGIACKDSFKRLLAPSIENEIRADAKERADREAIKVFSSNLRQLLLAPPLGQMRIMGIDPGFRTGCKIVCLDEQGKLLHNETIYPHAPQNEQGAAKAKIASLVNAFKIQAISIGNGTAGRETEELVKHIRFTEDVKVFVVNESGASVYSASSVAREEFPQYDITVRGAVSIGRRLADPLAELVKIEPKSIGVGQYQHDVDQVALQKSLDEVVESCVNMVGVEVNTASKQLLTHVSGLGTKLAQNIIDFRNKNGPFKSRTQFKKVALMGPKAFEQCAGFLRIKNAANPLDSSAVHPESYHIVDEIAKDLKCEIYDLINKKPVRESVDIKKYVTESVGMLTLSDIIKELAKPGLDPRNKIEVFEFDKTIRKMEDLHEDMVLPGIVTNITAFGAFVDIGIHENGLVHISQLADDFVKDPNEVVKVHQHVRVKIVSIDKDRKRIGFSMKGV